MGWLGLDDTDSLDEGCTTYTLHKLLEGLPNHVQATSLRLVRLWPFAQQRTRGNAAVAVELRTDDENGLLIYLDQFWNQYIVPTIGKVSTTLHDARRQYPSDPGMVWFSSAPPTASFYTACVQHEVQLSAVPEASRSWGGQGRIGATAAVAWHEHRTTFEAIAWRSEERHGQSERRVCESTLLSIDAMDSTFLSRDPRKGTRLIAPRGPCPVLFGVRARDADSARIAGERLRFAEATERTVALRVFTTNQATDDHLVDPAVKATVEHVEILPRGTTRISTNHGMWLAFEESGDVKLLAQWLKPGDEIEGYGLTTDAQVLHLEKLRLLSATPTLRRPMCVDCNVRMKSMGAGQGCRCPTCKARITDAWDEHPRLPPYPSWVQPPADARRHLAKPLEW